MTSVSGISGRTPDASPPTSRVEGCRDETAERVGHAHGDVLRVRCGNR